MPRADNFVAFNDSLAKRASVMGAFVLDDGDMPVMIRNAKDAASEVDFARIAGWRQFTPAA